MDIFKIYMRYLQFFLLFFLSGMAVLIVVMIVGINNFSFNRLFTILTGMFLMFIIAIFGLYFLPFKVHKAIYPEMQKYTRHSILNEIRFFKPFFETEKYFFEIDGNGEIFINYKHHQFPEFKIKFHPGKEIFELNKKKYC